MKALVPTTLNLGNSLVGLSGILLYHYRPVPVASMYVKPSKIISLLIPAEYRFRVLGKPISLSGPSEARTTTDAYLAPAQCRQGLERGSGRDTAINRHK